VITMKFTTIDLNQGNIPETAIIQKVISENDRLPNGEHEKAVQAFFRSDSIASGIGKDFAFVEKIPQILSDIIDNKSWECLYVSRGVVTPYYCRYTKGTDAENFRAFISAKRPNGLETTIETIDRLLEAEPEVQWKFRTIIYESRQGERNDLVDETCYSNYNKSEDSIGKIQKARIRAANRAAEAIPEIRELLDRNLIAIDIAAQLGRDIKNFDNLTAEEREYVDKRDLIGLRIKQYIYTNTMPEDEDKEPAYSRKLNEFVKDLLGIKDRSKTVRMDNPKKAAEKLLQFYQGDRLKELIKLLMQKLEAESGYTQPNSGESNQSPLESSTIEDSKVPPLYGETTTSEKQNLLALKAAEDKTVAFEDKLDSEVSNMVAEEEKLVLPLRSLEGETLFTLEEQPHKDEIPISVTAISTNTGQIATKSPLPKNPHLDAETLAKRLNRRPRSMLNVFYENPSEFAQWSKQRDPDGIAWRRSPKKKGRSILFTTVPEEMGNADL
jgi:hypothetical protein